MTPTQLPHLPPAPPDPYHGTLCIFRNYGVSSKWGMVETSKKDLSKKYLLPRVVLQGGDQLRFRGRSSMHNYPNGTLIEKIIIIKKLLLLVYFSRVVSLLELLYHTVNPAMLKEQTV